MRILAINGSPKGRESVTYRMLSEIGTGMQDAKKDHEGNNIEVEIVNLSEFKIEHCRGCFACWLKTPGKCIIKDDMHLLLEKFVTNDLIIYGTPLYIFNMTGLLKDFMDRCLPLIKPDLVESKTQPGMTTHPSRFTKPSKILLVSNCGFPEASIFDPLVVTFRTFAMAADVEHLGEILRPMGPLLMNEEMRPMLAPYYAALKDAGKQIVLEGKISDETKEKLRADILPGGAAAYRERVTKALQEKMRSKAE